MNNFDIEIRYNHRNMSCQIDLITLKRGRRLKAIITSVVDFNCQLPVKSNYIKKLRRNETNENERMIKLWFDYHESKISQFATTSVFEVGELTLEFSIEYRTIN